MIYLVRYLASLMQESDCITVMLTLIVKLIILWVSYRLIRRSYLEIALLYLYFAENKEDETQTDESVPSKSSVCFLFFGSVLFKTGNTYCAPCHIITCSDLHIMILKVLLEKSHKEIM